MGKSISVKGRDEVGKNWDLHGQAPLVDVTHYVAQ
jgi:hypothetical protein